MELDKYLYGLKQSLYKFNLHLTETLKSISYKQSTYDECLFYLSDETGFSIISGYTDDLLQCTNSIKYEQRLKSKLTEIYTDFSYDISP